MAMISRIQFGQTLVTTGAKKTSSNNLNNKAQIYLLCCEYEKRAKQFANSGQFDKAIDEYIKLKQIDDNYPNVDFELGRIYDIKRDYSKSIECFERYLIKNPNDEEVLGMLGVAYKKQGLLTKAIKIFEDILKADSNDDFAERNLKECRNKVLEEVSPSFANLQRENVKKTTLEVAKQLATDYLPKGFTKDMQDVSIEFNQTESLNGYSNIAQYEHSKRKITVTDEYTWANPILVGAYITHEFVHAKDNDGVSSIREEQDAFLEQAKFWEQHCDSVRDPEMDFVLSLYKQSPQMLNSRIREIYSARESNLPETSPQHPEKKQLNLRG